MSDFNHFDFIRDRKYSKPPTDTDLNEFNLFMTLMSLSMDNNFINICDAMNTEKFYKLPKNIQCLAFMSLNGKSINTSWKKGKKTEITENKDIIKKVMKVYDLSYNEAESCVNMKTVDLSDIDDLYTKIYDSSGVNFRKSRTKK